MAAQLAVPISRKMGNSSNVCLKQLEFAFSTGNRLHWGIFILPHQIVLKFFKQTQLC